MKLLIVKGVNKILRLLKIQMRVSLLGDYGNLEIYKDSFRPEKPKYVNIGAGDFFHPYWHNVDTPNEYYACKQNNLHISYDLTTHARLPIDDDSLEVVYCSHVIEHIDDSDVSHLFSETYRILKCGGVFRITCPDMDLEYEAYTRGDESFWRWPSAYGLFNKSIGQKFLDHFATALTESHPNKLNRKLTDVEMRNIFSKYEKEEAMNHILKLIPDELKGKYPADHINWFNVSKITEMLRKAGFQIINESKFGQSHCVLLRNTSLFDNTVPELSLYVECVKSKGSSHG